MAIKSQVARQRIYLAALAAKLLFSQTLDATDFGIIYLCESCPSVCSVGVAVAVAAAWAAVSASTASTTAADSGASESMSEADGCCSCCWLLDGAATAVAD